MDDIVRRFNGHLQSKTLIYITELHGTNISDGALHTKMISDPTISIEKKGINIFSHTNISYYVASSNDLFCLRLQISNRKHEVFEVSNKEKGKTIYFQELYKTFTQNISNHFYFWLYHLDLTNYPNPYELLQTQPMINMISLSLFNEKYFIEKLKSNEEKLLVPTGDPTILDQPMY